MGHVTSYRTCKRCARHFDTGLAVCPVCSQDQAAEVVKSITTAEQLAFAAFTYCTGDARRTAKVVAGDYVRFSWARPSMMRALTNEVVLYQLGLGYLLICNRFSDDDDVQDQIITQFILAVRNHLPAILKNGDTEQATALVQDRITECARCFESGDTDTSLIRLWQAHVEAAIYGRQYLGSDWANPSATSFLNHAVAVSAFIESFGAFLGRWDINQVPS